MAQLPLLPAGPLSAAVSRLLPEALPPPPDAAVFLGDLLDLRGGVSLADALYTLPPPGGALPSAEAAAALLVRVRDEGEALVGRMEDAFVHAFRPRYRLPGPARAYTLLEQSGAFAPKRSPRIAVAAARTLWAPYSDFLETHLKRAKFGLRDLRAELAPRLQALGPAAERLEKLESALSLSTMAETERLYRRSLHAVEQRFLEGLRAALKALPKDVDPTVIEAWYAPTGFVSLVFEDGRKLVAAIFAHERARLEALVHACAAG